MPNFKYFNLSWPVKQTMRKTSNKENYPKNTHNIPSPTLKKAEISRPVAHKSQKRSPLKTSCPKPLAAHKSPIDRERKFMQR